MAAEVDRAFKEEFTWEDKAKRNPLFAVMSAEKFSSKSGDPSSWSREDLNSFFEKGQFLYEVFLEPLLRRAPLEPGSATIAEYGCGMGRILHAARCAGYECMGIDISPTMIQHCRELVPGLRQLSTLDENGRSEIPSKSADFVFSYAVLQHIPRLSQVKAAITEMCRILKLGGVLRFQYRSCQKPFQDVGSKSTPAFRVWNFESRSLELRFQHLRGGLGHRLPRVPHFQSISHTYWVGVPLTLSNLQRTLNDCGVALTGLNADVGHKNMYWVTGQKTANKSIR